MAKIYTRAPWGPVNFKDGASLAEAQEAAEQWKSSGKKPITGKTVSMKTAFGWQSMTPGEFVETVIARPLPGEFFYRFQYYHANGDKPEAVQVYTGDGDKVRRFNAYTPVPKGMRQFFVKAFRNLGASKALVLGMFQEDAYRTGVVTKEEVAEYLAQVEAAKADAEAAKERERAAETPLESLELDTKVLGALQAADLNTVANVLAYTQEEGMAALLALKDFGPKAAENLSEQLSASGFQIPEPSPE